MVLSANSTSEMFGLASMVPVEQVMGEAAPAENTVAGKVFGVFMDGLANSGMFRMGSRDS